MKDKLSLARLHPKRRTRFNDPGISIAAFLAFLITLFIISCSKDVIKDQTSPTLPQSEEISQTLPADQADTVIVNPVVTVTLRNSHTPDEMASATIALRQGTTQVMGTVSHSGNTVSFTPSADLMPNTLFTARFVMSIKKDGSSNNNEHEWSFRTGSRRDNWAPTVVSVSPLNNAASVDVNTQLTVKFSREMRSYTLNTSTFTLKQGTKSVTGTVSCDDETAKFKPSSPLAGGTLYTVAITTGVKDEHGNAMSSNYSWSFTTAGSGTSDTTPPTVSSSAPANNATGVAVSVKPAVTFSEAMNTSSINATIFTLKQGTTSVSGTVALSGNTATFTPSGALTANTVYTGTIATGAKDAAGNALASAYTFSFTTAAVADVTPPTVTSVSPANSATNVAASSKVTATFSEAMNASMMTTSTFTLKAGSTTVAGTVTYSGTTATFSPSAALAASTVYSATITTGAKDAAGNAIASNYSWSFTTAAAADVTPPTVISLTPANSATNVATSSKVTATFSEAMNASTMTTSTFTLKAGSTTVAGTVTYSGTTATFSPSAALAASTVYSATITTGAKDAAGNAIASNYSWSFTTAAAADVTPPTVTSVSPANSATNVATSSKVTATFSEAMNASTINTTTITLKAGTTSVAGTVALSGNTATFTPTAALSASTVYTVTVTTGVKDAAGNAIASNYTSSFTTAAALLSFSTQVFPIIQAKCMPCHSGSSPSGGVSLTNYAQVTTQGMKIDNTTMYGMMGVTAAEQTLIKTWLSQGSPNN